MLIFLDTEFTSLDWEKELLSLGMVSEDNQHQLYLEVSDYQQKTCSDFVVDQVLPHFGKDPQALCPYLSFGDRIRSWFSTLPGDHVIICDSGIDAWLLGLVLHEGFPANVLTAVRLLGRELDQHEWELSLQSYFQAHPHLHRHHALHDAMAARWTYDRLILGRSSGDHDRD